LYYQARTRPLADLNMPKPYDEAGVRSSCLALHGYEPYQFQIDAAKSLYSGNDTVVIAPTGSGKSTLFRLPFYGSHLRRNAMVIIITPLKALQKEQARQ
jgi:ATP-dependent helicase YprA (DUF1998 family)